MSASPEPIRIGIWVLHFRFLVTTRWQRIVTPLFALAILLTPLTGIAILLTGLLLAIHVAIKIAMYRATRAAIDTLQSART